MVRDQEVQDGISQTAAGTDTKPRFPWKPAILVSTLLFLAENHTPAEVIDGDVETYLVQIRGNLLREVCYIAIALIGARYLLRGRPWRLAWRSPFTLIFITLLGWCLLSASWAAEPSISLKRNLAYLLMITGAAGISAAWPRVQILQFISVSGAAQLTAGILAEMATGYFTPWIGSYRFAGTQSWNVQGFCCLILVLSSLAAADADPRNKGLFRNLALYGLLFLVLTKSRSSMAGVTVGYFAYFLFTRPLVTKVWVSLAAFSSLLILYMSGALEILTDFLSRGGEGADNLTGRQPLWELVQTFVRQRPMTGYGFQDFWTVSNIDYFSDELHWRISSTHNTYLDMLLTLGYVGLVLHSSVLVLGIVRSRKLFNQTRSSIFALAAAMCAVFLVVGTLEAVVIISPGPYGFSMMLLIWSLCLEKMGNDDGTDFLQSKHRQQAQRSHAVVRLVR